MPNLPLIIGVVTAISAGIGLLLAVNLNSRKMRVMGRGMLAGSALGALSLGVFVDWFVAGLAVGVGLAVAVVLIFLFLDSWGLF